MYLEHFGLREFPFSLAPDPRFLYLSPQHREALAHLLYGVRSEGGFVQLTGEVGTGKTTVCRCFLEQLPAGTRAAVILNPALTAEELLAAVCDEFRVARPEGTAGVKALLDRINTFLLEVHAAGERAVLVIDEAQNLDAAVLEQVRLLTNLETSRNKLLQIILMGQPELRTTLARPDLRQLAQRITARFHIKPLSRAETEAYVRHRLGVAGCAEPVFPPELFGRLRRLSRGVPRLINILCDRSLLGAYVQGKLHVDRETLVRAAREVAGDGGWWLDRRQSLVAAAALAAGIAMVAALSGSGFVRGPRESRPSPPATAPPSPASPKASTPVEAPAASLSTPAALSASPRVGRPSSSPVSGVLRALLEQPEAASEEDAWRWLYRLWGVRARDGENGCTQALTQGLDCLRGDGGFEQMRRLDRPAIVRVRDAQGALRWLVLERLGERQATLVAGGARTVVDVARLDSYDIREFVLLWRPPTHTQGTLAAGDRGAGVAWLAGRLQAAEGLSGGAAAAANRQFDETMTSRVRSFQRSRGLEANGIAGPETLLLLEGEPAPGTPTLGGAR